MSSSPARATGESAAVAQEEIGQDARAEQVVEEEEQGSAAERQGEEEEAGNTSVMTSISTTVTRFLSRGTHPFQFGSPAVNQPPNEEQRADENVDEDDDGFDSSAYMNPTALDMQYEAEMPGRGGQEDPWSAPLS